MITASVARQRTPHLVVCGSYHRHLAWRGASKLYLMQVTQSVVHMLEAHFGSKVDCIVTAVKHLLHLLSGLCWQLHVHLYGHESRYRSTDE